MSVRSRRLPSRTVPEATAGSVKALAAAESLTARDRVSPREARLIIFVLSLLAAWAVTAVTASAGEELMPLRGVNGGFNKFVSLSDGVPMPSRAVRVASVSESVNTVSDMAPVAWKNGCAQTRVMVNGVPLELENSGGFGFTQPFVRATESGRGEFVRLLLEEFSK